MLLWDGVVGPLGTIGKLREGPWEGGGGQEGGKALLLGIPTIGPLPPSRHY